MFRCIFDIYILLIFLYLFFIDIISIEKNTSTAEYPIDAIQEEYTKMAHIKPDKFIHKSKTIVRSKDKSRYHLFHLNLLPHQTLIVPAFLLTEQLLTIPKADGLLLLNDKLVR